MTAAETFASRWARLKRNSSLRRTTEAVTDTPGLPMSDVSAGATGAAISQPSDAAADEAFDPAGLPSIASFTANTDIRGFLQSRVPAELTRAALRQAWASDPAIRDFIGIAENQWDFNDPNAIPGFGPLQAQDSLPALVARALVGPEDCAEMSPKVPLAVEPSLPAVTHPEPADLDQRGPPTSDVSPSVDARGPREDRSGEGAAAGIGHIAEEDDPRRNRGLHGSALPR
jgi:hypothetical protein